MERFEIKSYISISRKHSCIQEGGHEETSWYLYNNYISCSFSAPILASLDWQCQALRRAKHGSMKRSPMCRGKKKI